MSRPSSKKRGPKKGRTSISQFERTSPITNSSFAGAATAVPLPPTIRNEAANKVGSQLPASNNVIRKLAANVDLYAAGLILLPLLVLLAQRNPIFTPPRTTIDSWVYLGFFRNLIDFKRNLFPGTYYGSRLSWILPGYLVHHLLPPLIAAYVLHLIVYFVAVLSFYYTIARTIGYRTALLSSLCLGLYPYFWASVGWDYVDGAGIAYYLLTTALFSKSAFSRKPAWTLVAAGGTCAALVYSNLAWAMFLPIFAVHYLGLRGPSSFREWFHVIARALLCCAIGGAVVTLILGGINYWIDGNFWFYSSSLSFGYRTLSRTNPWYTPTYSAGVLVPWLWLPLLVLVVGAISCIVAALRIQISESRPLFIFFAEFLLMLGIMSYRQLHGAPMLGLQFYASYLIPVLFLAGAPLFWMAAERLTGHAFIIAVVAATIALGEIWWLGKFTWLARWEEPQTHVFLLAAAIALTIAASVARRSIAITLSIAGLFCFNTGLGYHPAQDHDANPREYQRVMTARATVEEIRKSSPIRWWYDEKEVTADDFIAISSTYLWGYTVIGARFPKLSNAGDVGPATIVAVVSSRPDTAELARVTLGEALRPRGLIPKLRKMQTIEDGTTHYVLALFGVEEQKELFDSVAAVINPFRRSMTLMVTTGGRPTPLPMSEWKLCQYPGAEGQLAFIPEGLRVETAKLKTAYATMYPALSAPLDGQYRFVLRYKPLWGSFTFGALPADESGWLGQTHDGFADGDDKVMIFDVKLKRGEGFRILTANNSRENHASGYLIKEVTIFRYREFE